MHWVGGCCIMLTSATLALKPFSWYKMIISASRRTDIPAFYSEWFINRIRAGYCEVVNPFNSSQIAHVSLQPVDVDIIVFWTRHAAPLMPRLEELDARGYAYYFLYSILGYPRSIEPYSPTLEIAIRTFKNLSNRIGAPRVIWRYDPILISEHTSLTYHQRQFQRISRSLENFTQRVIISFVDRYTKTRHRFLRLAAQGYDLTEPSAIPQDDILDFLTTLGKEADEHGMEVTFCAEEGLPVAQNVRQGKCIDDEFIGREFGIKINTIKDPYQRKACRCVISKDIGVYDSCLFGCRYCYACVGSEKAIQMYTRHNPGSPRLIG